MLTFTPSENADPLALAEYQARAAKLKPACTQCRKTLTKTELEAGRCSNRDDCRLRQIFGGAKIPGGKGVNIGEYHALLKYQATRERVHHVTTAAPATFPRAVRNAAGAIIDREPSPDTRESERCTASLEDAIAEASQRDEWKPLNPYAWNPRVAS